MNGRTILGAWEIRPSGRVGAGAPDLYLVGVSRGVPSREIDAWRARISSPCGRAHFLPPIRRSDTRWTPWRRPGPHRPVALFIRFPVRDGCWRQMGYRSRIATISIRPQISLRSKLPGNPAQDCSQLLKGLLGRGLRHAEQPRSPDVPNPRIHFTFEEKNDASRR